MGGNLNITEAKKFWKWFSENCKNFGDSFENTELLDELDIWLSRFGDFSWEVGPGKIKDNALVISPSGDLNLLDDTMEMISYAIECPNWEYYYAKPPKEWDLIFDFETNAGKILEIDASQWEYVLLKYEDGMFEIIIQSPQLKQLADEDSRTASEILLDGVLGEELRMKTIDQINIVDEFDQSYKGKASSINNLSNHLNSLVK